MATRKDRKDRKTRKDRKDRKERKSRKQSGGKTRKMSPWNKAVKRVYEELKRKDRKVSFGDALKEASRRKKAGTL